VRFWRGGHPLAITTELFFSHLNSACLWLSEYQIYDG
jgi:hypothetical protein